MAEAGGNDGRNAVVGYAEAEAGGNNGRSTVVSVLEPPGAPDSCFNASHAD
ncbi:hypothetical protein [Paenibacillus riograndensis]|uniref:hypothetical protein n=1 Tax=Paenibacillus riograndensis TaxID=483937 RepID=UPI0012FD40EC|nr:hypothetical protein [Paenibacillus riograndensis]